ncbi:MAG: hypothetical protein LBI05_09895 [Planctomycetaceae bacterium]|nr:hypothetical protein [Planctomycetaceae bacterium]
MISIALPGTCMNRCLFNEVKRPPAADVKFIVISNSHANLPTDTDYQRQNITQVHRISCTILGAD